MGSPRKQVKAEAGWTPYIWLAWLSFFVIDPAFHTFSIGRWALTLAATAVFLVLYFSRRQRKDNKTRLWIIAAVALLGVIFTATRNYGAIVFFAYAAAFAGVCGGTEVAVSILLALEASASLVMWSFHLPLALWVSTTFLIAAVGAMNIQYSKHIAADSRLLLAQEEIERLAKTAERERIARDLHDVLGHTLSVIILKSELASRIVDPDLARAIKEIRDVERISREALGEIRSALKGYRAAGLSSEFAQARETLETAGVKVQVSTGLNMPELGSAQEGILALVLREAVTNILRHSHATECNVSLTETDGVCALQIADNGSGSNGVEGEGIRGMRQRVEMLGGTLQRKTSPGTTLTVTLPRANLKSNPTP